jgi:hypothetical protein
VIQAPKLEIRNAKFEQSAHFPFPMAECPFLYRR